MKNRQIRAIVLALAGLLACLAYFGVARILQLNYTAKSLIKLALFLGLPLLYWFAWLRLSWREVINKVVPRKDQWPRLLLALAAGTAIIVAANLLVVPLCRLFGIESVVQEIRSRTHTTRKTLMLALFYIPLVNALAEELFFRSFCFLGLADLGFRRLALLFSAVLFSLYHLSIFQNWFSPAVLLLSLGGLFICGLLLNRIVLRDRHILGVWLLHGLVNVAIIAISLPFFP